MFRLANFAHRFICDGFSIHAVCSLLCLRRLGRQNMSFSTLKAAGTSSRTKTPGPVVAIGVTALAAAGYGWWVWTTQQTTVADKDASEAVAQPERWRRSPQRRSASCAGVETALVKDAAVIPLDETPAQTVAPLDQRAGRGAIWRCGDARSGR